MIKNSLRTIFTTLLFLAFTIGQVRANPVPFITLTFPNVAADTCYSGTIQYITWDHDPSVLFVTIVLTVDSGLTWDTLADNHYNLGFFEWTVPNVFTNRARVRVMRSTSFTPGATSAQWFPIRPPNPLLILTSPNGGEQIPSGANFPIQWSHAYLDSVNIEYSVDSAQTWSPIVTGYPANQATYNWTVPNTPSDDVYVRVKDFNSNASDRSNGAFSIFTAVPDVYLFSPIGGEMWAQGSIQNIQWTSDYIQDVSIEYSIDSGNTWTFITPSTPASGGSYLWNVPSTISNICFIRITDLASAATSSNSPAFAIIPPALQIFTPNGGESVSAGWPMLITWNGFLLSNQINVDYSIDNGITWLPIVTSVLNQNNVLWNLPYTPSTQCRVRVSDALFPAVFDVSDAVFEITPPVPLVQLLSPQTSVSWNLYSIQPIEYNAINVQSLKLELSVDSGQSYSTIATGLSPTAGVYNWLVDATPSTECLFRLTDENTPTAFDGSDSLFVISALPPQLILLHPSGNETFAQGSVQTINWYYETVFSVKIELSLDNGISWQTLAASVPATQLSFQWTVPFIASSQALIRISDSNNPLVSAVCIPFTVTPSSVSLVYPNGGESFVGLTDVSINWNPGGVNTPVTLEFTLNNGQSWNTIASSIPNSGQYIWTVPPGGSSQCRVRIKSVLNPTVGDVSDQSFTITLPAPQVRILYPNGGEYFGSGTQVPVQFVSYQVNYVRVEYRAVGAAFWSVASMLVSASQGLFYWQIPANLNDTIYELRILDASDFSLNDVTNGGFTIGSGSLVLNTPNGGSLNAGTPFNITWSAIGGSPYVDILLSQNDGVSYQSITANPVTNLGSFMWNVPYLSGNAFRIKVRDYFVPSVQDSSDQAFQIIGLNNQLNLTYPVGGEIFVAGSPIQVQWSPSSVPTIRIEFSSNAGTSWIPLASAVPGNAGVFSVTLPAVTTSQGRVRIVDENNLLNYHFSQQNFSVTSPFVNLNPVTSIFSNSQTYLTWTSAGVDFVDLFYKVPGGSWIAIDTAIQNLNYYSWSTPSLGAATISIKLAARNVTGSPADSTSSVAVTTNNAITLITFNSGSFLEGTSHLITWTCPGYNGLLNLEYSIDNGSTWTLLAGSVSASAGSYLWTLPNVSTTLGKVRLSGQMGISQQSSGTFSITTPPSTLSLLYPSGGDTLSPGNVVEILWQAPPISSVKLFYSSNGGLSWSTIGIAPATSSYFWTVSSTPTTTGLIRIENADDASMIDYGSGPFVIQGLPISGSSISVNNPTPSSVCKNTDFSLSVSGTSISPSAQVIVQISPTGVPFSSLSPMIQASASFFSAGIITCRLSESIPDGWYDVRIKASLPAINSVVYDSLIRARGTSFSLSASSTELLLPTQNSTQVQISPVIAGASYSLAIPGYLPAQNSPSVTVQALQPGFIAAEATITDTAGCQSQLSNQFLVEVSRLFHVSPCQTPGNSGTIRDLAFLTNGYGIAVMNTGNVLVSSDTGKTWTLSYNGLNDNYRGFSFVSNGNNWFVTSNYGSLLKSTNFGQTWVRQQLSTFEEIRDMIFISPGVAFLAGSNGMMKRLGNGSWNPYNSGTWNNLNSLASNSSGIYAVGEGGVMRRYSGLQIDSIDVIPGVDWKKILFVSDTLGFVVGAQGHVLATSDGGLTWGLRHAGLNYTLEGIARSGDTLFAVGSAGKVLFSPDMGDTWISASIGYPNQLAAAAGNPITSEGFIGGSDASVFRFRSLVGGPDTLSTGLQNIPFGVEEYAVFPNPARDLIQVLWQNNSIESVKLIEATGKCVLSNQLSSPAEAIWLDTTPFNRGIYLLQCTSGGITITKRIVLID